MIPPLMPQFSGLEINPREMVMEGCKTLCIQGGCYSITCKYKYQKCLPSNPKKRTDLWLAEGKGEWGRSGLGAWD